jgi:hypothetical protein
VTAVVLDAERLHVARDEVVARAAGRQIQSIHDDERSALGVPHGKFERDLRTRMKPINRTRLDAERIEGVGKHLRIVGGSRVVGPLAAVRCDRNRPPLDFRAKSAGSAKFFS